MKKPLSSKADFLVILLYIFLIHLQTAYSVKYAVLHLGDKQAGQASENPGFYPQKKLAMNYGVRPNFTKNEFFYYLPWGPM